MDTRKNIRRLYKDIDGHIDLGQKEKEKIRIARSSAVYGEITPAAAEKLIEYINFKPKDVFYDLGSGVGKLIIQAALLGGPKKLVGIELSSSRHKMAQTVLKQAQEEKLLKAKNVEFICGDILKRSLDEATVIYTCSTAFPGPFFNKVVNRIAQLKPGTLFISLDEAKPNKRLEAVDVLRLDMTWKRRSPVYVYRVVKSQ